MRIFIDAGHNPIGGDTGASGCGLLEHERAFVIADKLRALLVASGHSVKMSREKVTDRVGSSESESIIKRAAMANNWGAELFISIHCNAFNGKAKGTESLVYSLGSKAYEYAKRVQSAIVSKLGTVDRGVKERPDLGVLKRTAMPAILVETAFIDNQSDSELLRNRSDDFAEAIFQGVTGKKVEQDEQGQTVMKMPENVFVQEIMPNNFRIAVCDCNKRHVGKKRYFNAGYFSAGNGVVVPVGNLASDGNIILQSKDNAGWINVAGKALTTIYTTADGGCGIIKTDRLDNIPKLKNAVSGIPIIVNGLYVPVEKIQEEGYAGTEMYDTWHGFLGIRQNKLVYVAMKCGFGDMCWALVALGIYDAIKLDGGGSFILHDCKELAGTAENRKIHNVGVWW